MAEKKTTVSASESTRKKKAVTTEGGKNTVTAKPKGNATGRRIGAVILWVFAFVFEILAILAVAQKIDFSFLQMNPLVPIIILLVLDLICCIIGSMLWKQANHIDPASEKNKTLFWIWNNMGLIVTAAAFIPFIILTLLNKNADKNTKTVATIAAIVALLIGGACAYEWNPLSAEQKAEQEGIFADKVLPEGSVYFTEYGSKYHLYRNCSHLNNSEKVYEAIAGSESNEGKSCVDVALENGCNDVCKTCKKKFEEEVGLDAAEKLKAEEEAKKKAEEEAAQAAE
ncbi:MAG: hypothetical protein IK055_04600 [Lachnospiraceae bacterium]|nr:hypothetical protein [Lachnospiraceae bacterium]